MMNQNYDDTRTKVLIENTAQGVFKHLNEMKSSGRHKRWIWELLQNARDVSTDADNHLLYNIGVKRKPSRNVKVSDFCCLTIKKFKELKSSSIEANPIA